MLMERIGRYMNALWRPIGTRQETPLDSTGGLSASLKQVMQSEEASADAPGGKDADNDDDDDDDDSEGSDRKSLTLDD